MRLRTYEPSLFVGSIEVEDSEPVWNTHIEIYGSNITFKTDTGASIVSYWNGGPSGWDFPVSTEHQ